jgi:hypothetical protein
MLDEVLRVLDQTADGPQVIGRRPQRLVDLMGGTVEHFVDQELIDARAPRAAILTAPVESSMTSAASPPLAWSYSRSCS